MPGFTVPPGGQVTASVKGSYYLKTLAGFKNEFTNYVTMQGYRVVTLEVTTGWNPVEVEYVATVVIAPQASTTTDRIVDALRQAGEQASGGTSPTVTITAAPGKTTLEQAQPAPASSTLADAAANAVAAALKGVGSAVEGIGGAPKAITDLPKDIKILATVLAVGLVIIVGLVAFGPNVKSLAKAAA